MAGGGEQDRQPSPQQPTPSFRLLATMGAAAPPVAGPYAAKPAMGCAVHGSCFDSLACGGGIMWTAVRTGPQAVQIFRGAVAHVVLHLTEPVAAVQLGAAGQCTTAQSAQPQKPGGSSEHAPEGGGPVMVVVVGVSCRVWAWELRPHAAAANAQMVAPSAAVGAAGGDRAGAAGGAADQGRVGGRRGKRKLESSEPEGGADVNLMEVEMPTSTSQAIPLTLGLAGCAWDTPWLPQPRVVPQLQLQCKPLHAPPPSSASAAAGMPAGAGHADVEGPCAIAEPSLAAVPDVRGLQAAGGRAQVAAQVVWEYLEALLQGNTMPGSSQEGQGRARAFPIPLHNVTPRSTSSAALPRVLHTVASWAASPHLPPDTCCACYVSMPAAELAPLRPHLRGSIRYTWPVQGASAAGMCTKASGGAGTMGGQAAPTSAAAVASLGDGYPTQPVGWLLVGTSSGSVVALPVGTPLRSESSPGEEQAAARLEPSTAAGAGGLAVVAVVHASRLQLMWLPDGVQGPVHPAAPGPKAEGPPANAGAAPVQLLLHPTSGKVMVSPPDPCSSSTLVAGGAVVAGGIGAREGGAGAAAVGSRAAGGDAAAKAGSTKRHWASLAAVVRVSGSADSVCVQGDTLFYTTAGKLFGLDCRAIHQYMCSPSNTALEAVHIPTPAPVLLAAAPSGASPSSGGEAGTCASQARQPGSSHLVMITPCSMLLSMLCPAGASMGQGMGRRREQLGLRQLEQEMQELLGAVAHLSASQELLAGDLARLDDQIADLAVAIPAVQSINSGPAGVYCAVRPLYRLSDVVGGGQAGLALEISLHNGGHWALPPSHSLVAAWSGAPLLGGMGQQFIAHAAPLPPLPPGATHTRTCCLAGPAPGTPCQGTLKVLLCRHSAASPARAIHAALLHSVHLDLLHLHCPGPSCRAPLAGVPSLPQPPQLPPAAEARLLLQLPAWLFGRRPGAGDVLAALLAQGLSSLDLKPSPIDLEGPGSADERAGCAAGRSRQAQEERAARQRRQQQLAAVQLGLAPGQARLGGAGPAVVVAADSRGSRGAGGAAWWEPLLVQRRQARMLTPAVAFSLLPLAHDQAGRSMQSMPGASGSTPGAGVLAAPHTVAVHVELPWAAGATWAGAGGAAAVVDVSARVVPGRGPQAGASWQHAEAEVTARSAGAAALLEAHGALLRRVLALQDSTPDQDPPSGMRMGGAFLLPKGGATSAAQSAVESADAAALESALCTLRQLKARAVQLRDEAVRVQQAQRAVSEVQQGDAPTTADQLQSRGVHLRRDLVDLAVRLRQPVGSIPVILV